MNELTPADRVGAIARDIRKLFHLLAAAGDALHSDLAITASMRGVMESLAQGGPRTVPQMARARPVSRQHIQVLVDQLVAAGLVELGPNPAHKRSPLVALTAKGKAAFEVMSGRESALLERLADGMKAADLQTTLATLGTLKERLSAIPDVACLKTEDSDG